jgi:hypothetical protein
MKTGGMFSVYLVSCWFVQVARVLNKPLAKAMVASVRFQASLFGIDGEQRRQQGRISRQVLPSPYVSMSLPASTYRRRCVILANDSIVKETLLSSDGSVAVCLEGHCGVWVSRRRKMACLPLLTDIPLSLQEFTYFIVCLFGPVHKTSYCCIPVSKYEDVNSTSQGRGNKTLVLTSKLSSPHKGTPSLHVTALHNLTLSLR